MIRKPQRWFNQVESDIDYSFYKSLINKLLDLIKNYYDNELISFVLYGSVARGTAKKDRSWYWILAPNLRFGESFKI